MTKPQPQEQQTTTTTTSAVATVQTVDVRMGLISRAATWLEKQDSLVVVLLVILIAVTTGATYGIRYTVITLVPAHLAAIQEGYERIQKENNEHQKETTARYIEDKTLMRETHTRELMAISTEFRGIANQMQEVARKQDDLIRTLILKERPNPQ